MVVICFPGPTCSLALMACFPSQPIWALILVGDQPTWPGHATTVFPLATSGTSPVQSVPHRCLESMLALSPPLHLGTSAWSGSTASTNSRPPTGYLPVSSRHSTHLARSGPDVRTTCRRSIIHLTFIILGSGLKEYPLRVTREPVGAVQSIRTNRQLCAQNKSRISRSITSVGYVVINIRLETEKILSI
jgi:hypothetical protein